MFKVGDEVYIKGHSSSTPYTILYIHNRDPSRKYYVVAYMGDMPYCVSEKSLIKKAHYKHFYIDGVGFQVEVINGKPDWTTVK